MFGIDAFHPKDHCAISPALFHLSVDFFLDEVGVGTNQFVYDKMKKKKHLSLLVMKNIPLSLQIFNIS